MSWDSYLGNLVERSKDSNGAKHVDKCCIIGLDGGAKWTSDGEGNAMKIQPNEAAQIAKCLKSKEFTHFQSSGILIDGVKYNFLRSDETVVFGKKKGCGSVTMQATGKAVIIAHCPEGSQQGLANEAVAKIAEYLVGSGY